MRTLILPVLLLVSLLSVPAVRAGSEGMKDMPKIAPENTYIVQSAEKGKDLLEQRGYGDQEPAVRMMNLMMVGGSGMEGMDMSQMTMASAEEGHEHAHGQPVEKSSAYQIEVKTIPSPPKVGVNVFEARILGQKTKKPALGLKLHAKVFMTSMDMGTEEPRVKEISDGRYRVKVSFTMAGPWAVELKFPNGEEIRFTFQAGK